MINEDIKFQLISSKMGILTHVADNRALSSGIAMIQSISETNILVFSYLDQIENDTIYELPNALLTVQDTDNQLFITVSGTAKVEKDREEVESLWNENNENWFGSDKSDKHVFLIRLKVESVIDLKD